MLGLGDFLPPLKLFLSASAFDCHPVHTWVVSNQFRTPLVAVSTYVFSVFVLLPLVRWRTSADVPAWMAHAFALWNLALSLFSSVGFVVCFPFALQVLSTGGLRALVCSDDMMLGGAPGDDAAACYGDVGFMMTLFMFSKIPELTDTFFLVLMHKRVDFLHWYHHATVLLYSWFAYHFATPSAVMFGTMNYAVHSVMYFYFFASPYWNMRILRQPITALQVGQMVVGLAVVAAALWFQSHGGCSATYSDSGFFGWCALLYGSYTILFVKLYYNLYVSQRGGNKRGSSG
jgi:hypothetical protein